MARHQSLADHETEDCIAQKFELLVVGGGLFRASFRTAGFVRQRAFQEFSISKPMAKNSFEYLEAGAHVRGIEAGLQDWEHCGLSRPLIRFSSPELSVLPRRER